MKTITTRLSCTLIIIIFTTLPRVLFAQGTAVTYQGRVLANGAPFNGPVNMTFTLFSDSQANSPLTSTITNLGVPVTNGLFTVQIDFGTGIYTGAVNSYWLEIGVQGGSDTNFNTLSPRQQLTPAPFAVTAENLAGVAAYNNVNVPGSATVAGGYSNSATAYASAILGGQYNVNSSLYGTIGGGYFNSNSSQYGTIAGGQFNTNYGYSGTVAGGYGNVTSNFYAVVGGGDFNFVNSEMATVAGGGGNTNTGFGATIGGGYLNSAFGQYSTVGGGAQNVTSNFNTTVAGGMGNKSLLNNAAVGGGFGNSASGNSASIPGGAFNAATGRASIVAGGQSNNATGDYSFAAGAFANAVNNNSFVWNDGSGGIFSSTAANQFSVRAAGGITLAGDVAMAGGANTYHHFSVNGGNSTGFLYGSYHALFDGVHLGYNWYADDPGTPHIINTGGGTSRISAQYGEIQLATGPASSSASAATPIVRLDIGTSTVTVENAIFNSSSDRNVKQDFTDISPAQILEKVAQLPVTEWSYKFDTAIRHVGPMAQDFYAAFNIGTDDRHIAPIDEGGVALAAIQGLNQKLDAKDAEIRELKANVAELKKLVEALAEKK